MEDITQQDRLLWYRHLQSGAGQHGLAYLREAIPPIAPNDPDRMIFSAGVTEGWRQAINEIVNVLANRQKSPEEIDVDN